MWRAMTSQFSTVGKDAEKYYLFPNRPFPPLSHIYQHGPYCQPIGQANDSKCIARSFSPRENAAENNIEQQLTPALYEYIMHVDPRTLD